MTTFKQMIQSGTIKRADAMKVQPCDLHEEPGFNLRRDDDDFQASIDELTDYILAGGTVPPLEVRPRDDGGVFVVDGHRRRRAYLQAIERGAPIEWIEVRAFQGNDVDRVTRVMTSAEGRALKPLETAEGYKRMAAYGLSSDQIAAKVHKTRTHVDQLLILSNAPHEVQQRVADGRISASLAIDIVRKFGEGAGEFLKKLDGKTKVTPSDFRPKALPRDVVDDVIRRVETFAKDLPHAARVEVFGAERSPHAVVTLPAAMVRDLIAVQTSIVEARDKQAERARAKEFKAAQQ